MESCNAETFGDLGYYSFWNATASRVALEQPPGHHPALFLFAAEEHRTLRAQE